MERTWKGTTAGILTIIAGCIGIGAGAIFAIGGGIATALTGIVWLAAAGAGVIAIGIIALIGGIYMLKRKLWGFALTGAILATLVGGPLGILAIIFVVKGKKEFS